MLRQLSQPTESTSTQSMTSAWLSQSSPGPSNVPSAAAAAAVAVINPPMSNSSSSSSSSWPGHGSVAEMPVLVRQSPVHVKQDADAFQPPPPTGKMLRILFCSSAILDERVGHTPHHGRTFSTYLCHLSFWLTLPWGVMLQITVQ